MLLIFNIFLFSTYIIGCSSHMYYWFSTYFYFLFSTYSLMYFLLSVFTHTHTPHNENSANALPSQECHTGRPLEEVRGSADPKAIAGHCWPRLCGTWHELPSLLSLHNTGAGFPIRYARAGGAGILS